MLMPGMLCFFSCAADDAVRTRSTLSTARHTLAHMALNTPLLAHWCVTDRRGPYERRAYLLTNGK